MSQVQTLEVYDLDPWVRTCWRLLLQARFVEQLYASGMVDEEERGLIMAPIHKQERSVQRQGAVWRSPSVSEVASLPEKLSHSTIIHINFEDIVSLN